MGMGTQSRKNRKDQALDQAHVALRALVKLLARQAAREAFAAEMAIQEKKLSTIRDGRHD